MSRRWTGPARAATVLVIGAGLVVAAGRVPETVRVGEAVGGSGSASSDAAGDAAQVPVRLSHVTCPGPETEGVPGVPAVTGGTSAVFAATAPAAALGGLDFGGPDGATEPGSLVLRAQPDGTNIGTGSTRGATVVGGVSGVRTVEVTASGTLAPGLAALQTWLRRDSDDRGLDAAACQAPRAEAWLVGGGGDSTRRERIVVANPGGNAITVDVQVHGIAGPLPSVGGSRIAVPAHGRVSLLLDALAAGEAAPIVHVTAAGGVMTAVLEDSWIAGAVGRGRDDAAPAAGPHTEQVIPAAYLAGSARLRIGVPGTAEAVVQARALSAEGPVPLPEDPVVRIGAGATRDIDLSKLPAGAYAVQVRADQPIVAAVMAERRTSPEGQSDLAWVASTPAITGVAGTPVPGGAKASLMVVATGAPAVARLFLVQPDGAVRTQEVSAAADTVVAVDVTGASSVWVRQVSGTVRAGVSLQLDDPGGPLFSLVALWPATVSTADTPIHEIRR